MSLADRFWSKVRKGDGCWEWTAATVRGYGYFWRDGKQVKAHRVSFELANGRPPRDGMSICHSCDNRRCVRPDHVFEGTTRDNMQDASRKGRLVFSPERLAKQFERAPKGERNRHAKMTDGDVLAIRRAYTGRRGEQAALAREYGVRRALISRIVRNETWRHLAGAA